MNIIEQLYQGDCQAHTLAELPEGLGEMKPLPKEGHTVLIGEGSNHHHVITATKDSEVYFTEKDGYTYLNVVKGTAELQHLTMPQRTQADHPKIVKEVGFHVFGPQWEYDEIEERRVMD